MEEVLGFELGLPKSFKAPNRRLPGFILKNNWSS